MPPVCCMAPVWRLMEVVWPAGKGREGRRASAAHAALHLCPSCAQVVQLVQGNAAHFGLARGDVRREEGFCIAVVPREQRLEDCGVLLVGMPQALAFGEVEPPDDADALGNLLVNPRHLAVAGSRDDGCVKAFIELRRFPRVAQSLSCRYDPDSLQRLEGGRSLGGARTLGRLDLDYRA